MIDLVYLVRYAPFVVQLMPLINDLSHLLEMVFFPPRMCLTLSNSLIVPFDSILEFWQWMKFGAHSSRFFSAYGKSFGWAWMHCNVVHRPRVKRGTDKSFDFSLPFTLQISQKAHTYLSNAQNIIRTQSQSHLKCNTNIIVDISASLLRNEFDLFVLWAQYKLYLFAAINGPFRYWYERFFCGNTNIPENKNNKRFAPPVGYMSPVATVCFFRTNNIDLIYLH